MSTIKNIKLIPQVLFPLLLTFASVLIPASVNAHHSFAMYDSRKTYVFTGVITRVAPDPAHLQIFFVPLDNARQKVVRDENGEPIQWGVEMADAARIARQGITVNDFPRGTIFSVGLHPLRNDRPAGGRGNLALYKCPANTPPAPGMHCDSVEGATKHGPGELEEATSNPYAGI